ncbi:unnamed protein product, partial [Polarella glacialis]
AVEWAAQAVDSEAFPNASQQQVTLPLRSRGASVPDAHRAPEGQAMGGELPLSSKESGSASKESLVLPVAKRVVTFAEPPRLQDALFATGGAFIEDSASLDRGASWMPTSFSAGPFIALSVAPTPTASVSGSTSRGHCCIIDMSSVRSADQSINNRLSRSRSHVAIAVGPTPLCSPVHPGHDSRDVGAGASRTIVSHEREPDDCTGRTLFDAGSPQGFGLGRGANRISEGLRSGPYYRAGLGGRGTSAWASFLVTGLGRAIRWASTMAKAKVGKEPLEPDVTIGRYSEEFEAAGGSLADIRKFAGELGTDYTFLGYDGSFGAKPQEQASLAFRYLLTEDDVPRYLKYWSLNDMSQPKDEVIVRVEEKAAGPGNAVYHMCTRAVTDCKEKWVADEQVSQAHVAKWQASCPYAMLCDRFSWSTGDEMLRGLVREQLEKRKKQAEDEKPPSAASKSRAAPASLSEGAGRSRSRRSDPPDPHKRHRRHRSKDVGAASGSRQSCEADASLLRAVEEDRSSVGSSHPDLDEVLRQRVTAFAGQKKRTGWRTEPVIIEEDVIAAVRMTILGHNRLEVVVASSRRNELLGHEDARKGIDGGGDIAVLTDRVGDERERRYLSRNGLKQMALLMGRRQGLTRPGGLTTAEVMDTVRIQAYLCQVFLNRHPPATLGERSHRELLTLAQAVDETLDGDLTLAGDTLMQRMKGIEFALSQGGWGAAKNLELIPESSGMLSREEQPILVTLRPLVVDEKEGGRGDWRKGAKRYEAEESWAASQAARRAGGRSAESDSVTAKKPQRSKPDRRRKRASCGDPDEGSDVEEEEAEGFQLEKKQDATAEAEGSARGGAKRIVFRSPSERARAEEKQRKWGQVVEENNPPWTKKGAGKAGGTRWLRKRQPRDGAEQRRWGVPPWLGPRVAESERFRHSLVLLGVVSELLEGNVFCEEEKQERCEEDADESGAGDCGTASGEKENGSTPTRLRDVLPLTIKSEVLTAVREGLACVEDSRASLRKKGGSHRATQRAQ